MKLAPRTGIVWFAALLAVAGCATFVCTCQVFGIELNSPKRFPADAVVTVLDYGAKGDGTTDDTAALKKAIEENVGKKQILFFPKGTYLISDTLAWKDAQGKWQAWLSLQGESALTTKIRLKDATFTDSKSPKSVIFTASQNPLKPLDGGGNQAFGISICDLTVDVGTGNPGAIGIEYLANNKGMLESVVVRSSDPNHLGTAGVAMLRPLLGPCFLKNVEVDGFDCGIDVAQPDASATIEHVLLKNQRMCALRNAENCLAIRDLVSENSVPAVISRPGKKTRSGPGGLVVLVDSKLLGGSSDRYAIENLAHLFVRNTQTNGYKAAILDRGKVVATVADGEYTSQIIPSRFGGQQTSLNLPVMETPTYWDNDLAHWKSVGKPNGTDDTARIQAALDSGATTVYFPPGEYRISDTLFVRGRVKHLIGMDALLKPAKNHVFTKQPDTKPVFRFETPHEDVPFVVFERFNLFFQQGGRAIEDASRKDLVIRSVISWASGGGYRNEPGAGRLFIEDFDPGNHQNDYTVFRGQKVWARQFDPEPLQGPHVVNDGGDLWILGYKTEGIGPVMLTKGGGRTEVLGGLHIWPIDKGNLVLTGVPVYVLEDGEMSTSFVTERWRPWDHDLYFRETRAGVTRDTRREELPGRFGHPSNFQRAVPLFVGRSAKKGER